VVQGLLGRAFQPAGHEQAEKPALHMIQFDLKSAALGWRHPGYLQRAAIIDQEEYENKPAGE